MRLYTMALMKAQIVMQELRSLIWPIKVLGVSYGLLQVVMH